MKKLICLVGFLSILFISFGCAQKQILFDGATGKEVDETIETIAEAITGKDFSQEEVQALKKQVVYDEEARSAVEKITNVMRGERIRVKICPETGERFSASLEYCPGTDIPLIEIEP
jgi:hypothetical protein